MKKSFFNAEFILSRSRLAWIDYARGISIILVCFRHCYEGLEHAQLNVNSYPWLGYLNVFFFSFRMPLFFIISGLFVGASLNKKGIASFIEDRFKLIFYPLLVWGSIQITLQMLMSNHTYAKVHPSDYINLIIGPRKVEQFWYLNALFFVGVLYALVRVKLKMKTWHQLILGTILYFLANLAFKTDTNLGFLIDVFEFYIFFAIGDAIASIILKKENFALFSSWKLFIPLSIAFVLFQHNFTVINLENVNDYYIAHARPLLFLSTALLGCAFVMNVSFILQKTKAVQFLRVIGYHSLFIYCMHLIIIAGVRMVMTKVLGVTNVPFLLTFAIFMGIIIPMLVYNISLRLNMWWLFTMKKPTDEINHIIKPAVVA